MCVCVRARACVRACVRVCVCVRAHVFIGALDDDLAREDVFHHMITDRALRRMCRKFGAWEDVAMQLDLTKADRENIEHDGPWTRSLPAQVSLCLKHYLVFYAEA